MGLKIILIIYDPFSFAVLKYSNKTLPKIENS